MSGSSLRFALIWDFLLSMTWSIASPHGSSPIGGRSRISNHGGRIGSTCSPRWNG
jgi:hypothetical protein